MPAGPACSGTDISKCNVATTAAQRPHAASATAHETSGAAAVPRHGPGRPTNINDSDRAASTSGASASYTNAGARDFGGDDDGNTGRQPKRTKRMEGTVAAAAVTAASTRHTGSSPAAFYSPSPTEDKDGRHLARQASRSSGAQLGDMALDRDAHAQQDLTQSFTTDDEQQALDAIFPSDSGVIATDSEVSPDNEVFPTSSEAHEGLGRMLDKQTAVAQDDRMSTTSMLGNHDGSDDTTGDSRANDAGIACAAAAKTCTAAAKACAAASSARNTAGNACTAPGTASASAGHAAASAAAHDDSQSAHNDAVAGRVTNMEAIVPDSSNHLLILSESKPLMVNKLGRTSQLLCFKASCACVLVCHCQRQLLWSQARVRFQPPETWTGGGEELQRLKDWRGGLQVLSPGNAADAQCELGGTHGLLYLLDRVGRHNGETYAPVGQLVLTLGQGTWRLPLKIYSKNAFCDNMRNGRGAKRRSLERFD